ncbi:hypothetical protein [Snodgrassella sp. ESL0324]|uniref:hypothetical protein n=1 Tax=Snodgrassella sp. ESL0324 TaxID=2705033 RepID=UPI001583840D|nr:hypothetical protein [Snodgrassella sp. ESL0324]NUF08939.1 hypothetical protein [Snodgrassella sp. ESL0324]
MLEQPLNSTETTNNSLNSTTLNETGNTVPQVISTQNPATVTNPGANTNVFNISKPKERRDLSNSHSVMIKTSGIAIAQTKGGTPNMLLESAIVIPISLTLYDKLSLNDGNSEETPAISVTAYNGIVEEEGVSYSQEDYLAKVRKQYPKADWKKRGALYCKFVSGEPLKSKGVPTSPGIELALKTIDFVTVFLSPTSLKAWDNAEESYRYQAAWNPGACNCVQLAKIDKEAKIRNSNVSWSQFEFTAVNVVNLKEVLARQAQQNSIAIPEQAA